MIDLIQELNNKIESKIDRSKWQKWKFSELVENINEKVVPKDSGLEHYIGLEHLDSGSLHIKRFGETSSLVGEKLKIYKGDIIFAKRNAYLKRVAIAEFDAVASAHSLVLRAKSKNVVPAFLPFFLLSDTFWNKAIEISVGSLSPTINWPVIAKQEFFLPPIEQQIELGELFWKAYSFLQTNNRLNSSFENLEKTLTKDIFLSKSGVKSVKTPIGIIPEKWKCLKLEELINDGSIVSHLDGNHGSFYPKNSEFVNEGVPYISANCIDGNYISFLNAKYLTEERSSKIKKGVSYNGDILLAHNATVGPVCILNTDFPKVILSTTLTHYRINPEKLDRDYVFYFMKSRLFQSQLEKVMSQSTRNQVPITTQRNLYFIIPPIDIQKEIVINILNVVETKKLVFELMVSSSRVLFSLINKVF